MAVCPRLALARPIRHSSRMTSKPEIPSLFEWLGGNEKLTALFSEFYRRVPGDPLLGPVFAAMDKHHSEHVAAFVGQVFGGPNT